MRRESSRRASAPRLAGGALALLLCFFAPGCGYRVAGRTNHLPVDWKAIAVPTLVNHTAQYRIEQRLTSALVRELLARTSYRIVQDENSADAVLRGDVTGIDTSAVLFDTATGRATTVLVTLHVNARLADRATKKVIYQNDNFVFRDEYQISTDAPSFFEERDPALDRMAHDFASALVSAILENF